MGQPTHAHTSVITHGQCNNKRRPNGQAEVKPASPWQRMTEKGDETKGRVAIAKAKQWSWAWALARVRVAWRSSRPFVAHWFEARSEQESGNFSWLHPLHGLGGQLGVGHGPHKLTETY